MSRVRPASAADLRCGWRGRRATGAGGVTAASLNKRLGLSFGKIVTLFADRFGLTVTRGAVVRALHRAARQHSRPMQRSVSAPRVDSVRVSDPLSV
jgi:hypothetical protein